MSQSQMHYIIDIGDAGCSFTSTISPRVYLSMVVESPHRHHRNLHHRTDLVIAEDFVADEVPSSHTKDPALQLKV